jgi:putative peptidoglycan lipid II flippase
VTSTSTSLPDRYRPLDQIAPDERTATGVIRSWRARDKVLNRDVAVRVHTPGGPAAREWITRALTAGGLATPALAMVYDAAENSHGIDGAPGAAYVVNEWLDGQTLAERLRSGPLSERDARNLVRRLAEGVAEAHRVGLAVGGLTPEHVVLRPGGLVGLLAVPAASGTVQGDIAALGALLEGCLTGWWPGEEPSAHPPNIPQPDLAALVRRARSNEPGALASVAAMAALLAERRPTGSPGPVHARNEANTDSGWLRRLRDRRDLADAEGRSTDDGPNDAPVRMDRQDRVPAPLLREDGDDDGLLPWGPAEPPAPRPDEPAGGSAYDQPYADRDDEPYDDPDADPRPDTAARRRLAVIGLPLLALVVVIAIAWFVGTSMSNVANKMVDDTGSSVPAPTTEAPVDPAAPAPAQAGPLAIAGASVFDPVGDSDNADEAGLSFDGDPGTSWETDTYRNSPAFGNLKPGLGIRFDLGSTQAVEGLSIVTSQPGTTVEIRVGNDESNDLEAYPVVATSTLGPTTDVRFTAPQDARYVLVWLTALAPADGGFSGGLAEVAVDPPG